MKQCVREENLRIMLPEDLWKPREKGAPANAMFRSKNHPFMLADVDRMIVGENAGLECKTASPYMEDKWKDGKIPMSYQVQCHHYMAVCGADAWYIAVLIYGREFKYYKIERDEALIADLVRIEQDFWENHVQKGIMPAPDGSKTADSVIAEYYKIQYRIGPLSGLMKSYSGGRNYWMSSHAWKMKRIRLNRR